MSERCWLSWGSLQPHTHFSALASCFNTLHTVLLQLTMHECDRDIQINMHDTAPSVLVFVWKSSSGVCEMQRNCCFPAYSNLPFRAKRMKKERITAVTLACVAHWSFIGLRFEYQQSNCVLMSPWCWSSRWISNWALFSQPLLSVSSWIYNVFLTIDYKHSLVTPSVLSCSTWHHLQTRSADKPGVRTEDAKGRRRDGAGRSRPETQRTQLQATEGK